MKILGAVNILVILYSFYFISLVESGLTKLGIIGGELAVSIPYQASLRHYNYHHCGAVIIKKAIVVTAAHCIYKGDNPNLYSVRAGSNEHLEGGQLVPVIDYVIHPKYKDSENDYDIALVFLGESFKFDKRVQPIKMIKANEPIPTGVNATISGWGVTSENATNFSYELRFAHVPLVDQRICSTHIGTIKFTERMVCVGYLEGGVDSCYQDSGGPLVANQKLIGIVSVGDGCGQKNQLGIYSNVASLRKWIDHRVTDFNNSKKFFKVNAKSQ